MKVLVDEDLASDELLTRLRSIPDLTVILATLGTSDEDVWEQAQAEEAAVLTGKVRDFRRLAEEDPAHHGLLVVYRRNDASRDLRFVDIAAAVAAIGVQHADGVAGNVFAVNAYVARP